MLNDYLGLATYIEGIGNLYPIKILEYENFKKIANKYIMPDKYFWEDNLGIELECDLMTFLFKYISNFELSQEEISLYDEASQNYLKILKEAPQESKYSFSELKTLLEMILHKEVYIDEDSVEIKIGGDILEDLKINKNNFEEFREVVMRQNMIFAPLHYEDYSMQCLLESMRKKRMLKGSSDEDVDIESLCQTVALIKGLTPNELKDYTYYQLIADYYRTNQEECYDWTKRGQTSGFGSKNVKVPNRAKKIDMYKHPEAFEFTKKALDDCDNKLN